MDNNDIFVLLKTTIKVMHVGSRNLANTSCGSSLALLGREK